MYLSVCCTKYYVHYVRADIELYKVQESTTEAPLVAQNWNI